MTVPASIAGAHLAVVLAAGGSRRLGRPKQLLTRDGETLVHRTARLAIASGALRTLVVLGAERDAIRAAVRDLPCTLLDNRDWAAGLSSSLACAAAAIDDHDGPVLITGCDQPALMPAHLHALLDGSASVASACAATLHDGRYGAPVVLPADWLRDATQLRGDHGFGTRLRALPAGAVWSLDAPELMFDLDTEHDVAAAIERGWLDATNAH